MDLLGTVSRVRLDQGGLKMMKKLLASLSASVTHPLSPFLVTYRRTCTLAPIHLNIIISFREPVFQRHLSLSPSPFLFISSSFSPPSLPSLSPDLIVRVRVRPPRSLHGENHLPPLPSPGTNPPPSGDTLHLPEHHHLRINRVWKINAPRGDPEGLSVERKRGKKKKRKKEKEETQMVSISTARLRLCQQAVRLLMRFNNVVTVAVVVV